MRKKAADGVARRDRALAAGNACDHHPLGVQCREALPGSREIPLCESRRHVLTEQLDRPDHIVNIQISERKPRDEEAIWLHRDQAEYNLFENASGLIEVPDY
jgi:hypothetical protein